MSATVEAIALPLLLLTVAWLGGVRVTDRIALVPPPLFALVLGVLLLGVLVRSGAFAPDRLMNRSRTVLANANGFFVLTALFAASVQAFNLIMPETGLPHVIGNLFLLVLLLNTLAASPDRVRVLRSLLVTFGFAFVIKFIVLAALSDPSGGALKRVLLVMLEGLTLGTLTQTAFNSVTGYLAFATLALFLIALALLPSSEKFLPVDFDRRLERSRTDDRDAIDRDAGS
jgi:hypothetical protein